MLFLAVWHSVEWTEQVHRVGRDLEVSGLVPRKFSPFVEFDVKATQKGQHMSVHGNTHLPERKMKATLLMKSEGGRKKVKAEWKNLQEVNKENKGQLYVSSYFTPEMAGQAKELLPSVFNTEIQCN